MVVRILTGLAVVPLLLGAAAVPGQQQRVSFSFQDPEISEASALVALSGGRFATTNDSGDSGRVFTVDAAGRTVGVTTWSDSPEDVEALARCRTGSVWVGDIGDNLQARESIEVAEVPVGPGDREVAPAAYDLVYPDGPHDAETLLCHPRTGRLYVVTKEFLGGRLYALPNRLDAGRPNRLRPVGTMKPIATDGAFFPDGRHVVVRGYYSADVYRWPSLQRVARLDLPRQEQGEGIGVAPDGRVYVSSEGVGARVLEVRLPARVRRLVSPPEHQPEPSASPSTPAPGSPTSPAGSGGEDGTVETAERGLWPWALGGLVGLGAIAVLIRSLRPR